MAGRPRSRPTATTRIANALSGEIHRRGVTKTAAAATLGISAKLLSEYLSGRTIPGTTADPRRLAAFLQHEDGQGWTVEEVLDVLAQDRAEKMRSSE